MPVLASKGNVPAFGYGLSASGQPPEELGGMVLLTPTSISYSGTSASISANGSVDFTSCTSLSLNGVFSADYENYMVVAGQIQTTGDNSVVFQLRQSGVNSGGSGSYITQTLSTNNTSIFASRTSTSDVLDYTFRGWFASGSSTLQGGVTAFFYRPYLAQRTAFRMMTASPYNNIWEISGTHQLASQYDGISFFDAFGASNFMSGNVAVYGLVGI